jgi:hypothetical protein
LSSWIEYSDEKYTTGLQEFEKYFENKWKWSNDSISEYVSRVYLKPNKPKFLYYDEYFSLSAIKSSKSSLSKISDVLMSASSNNAFAVFNSSRLLFSNFSILILDGREKYSS